MSLLRHRRVYGSLFLLCAAALTIIATAQQPQSTARDIVDGVEARSGEVLVKFRKPSSTVEDLIDRLVDADEHVPVGAAGWRRIHSVSHGAAALRALLAARGEIEAVEPNYIVHATAVPNDPSFSQLWAFNNPTTAGADIHAIAAWDVSTGSRANVVGVVDTGIDYNHGDLQANIWSAPSAFTVTIGTTHLTCPAGSHGFNAIAMTCDPMDDNGHGTHTSGTVGAVGNNSVGVAGVNWTASIMALKFLGSTGSGSVADAINAIDFAIQAKSIFGASANVRVLSNSWSGASFTQSLLDEVNLANSASMLFVAAAGNSTTNIDSVPAYPASYKAPNVIAVAATTNTDTLASFSNYGPTSVHLGAPGVNIYSTVPNNSYAFANGTSMATPLVAGSAALVLSKCALSTDDLKAAILAGVDVVPGLAGMVVTGGRLNVNNVIRACSTTTVNLTSPPAGSVYTAPATIPLAATATAAGGRTIDHVDFLNGSSVVGTATASPYQASWSPVGAGTYTLSARAVDSGGTVVTSAARTVTVSAASGGASATFIGFDTTTQGTWRGVYGSDGAALANDSTAYPGYAQVAITGAATYTWNGNTTDPRALQRPSDASRIAACWYTDTSYTTDINLVDGAAHQVAFYVLDWEGRGRLQQVEIRDAVSGTLLDSRSVSSFSGGEYLVWTLRGHVSLRVVNSAGLNAVASGIFFGGAGAAVAPPTVTLTAPANGATFTAPASIAMSATATAGTGRSVDHVDFLNGSTVIGTATASPYSFNWTGVAAGTYSIAARVTDSTAVTGTSAISTVVVSAPPVPPTVTLTGPASGATFTAPATVALTASAAASAGHTIDHVDFLNGSTVIGTATAAPYGFSWSPVAAGTYTLSARAVDNASLTTISQAATITVVPASGGGGAATFMRTDVTTLGSWRGVYGSAGALLANDATISPSYAQVTITGASTYTWNPNTTDPRGLQRPSDSTRVAACWYTDTSYTTDINVVDGAAHQIALYLLDWEARGRLQQVEIRDADTGTLLDTRSVSAFSGGEYLVWTVRGHVIIRVINSAGLNAVASALFFD